MLKRTNLTDQITQYIQSEILKGTWAPGDKIPSETELAESLGVSRMSLRSSIQRLNAIGLTETRVGEGTFVRKFDLRSYFGELYNMKLLGSDPTAINDLRCVLQIASVRLSLADGLDDNDLLQLEGLFSRMQDAVARDDIELFHKLDFQFHRAVCGLCHNQPLYIIYDALEFVISEITRKNVEKSVQFSSGFEKVIEHHRKIIECIKAGDIDRFVSLMMTSRERSKLLYTDSGLIEDAV